MRPIKDNTVFAKRGHQAIHKVVTELADQLVLHMRVAGVSPRRIAQGMRTIAAVALHVAQEVTAGRHRALFIKLRPTTDKVARPRRERPKRRLRQPRRKR